MKYINRVILAMAVAALGLAAILTSGPSVAPAATSTTLPAFGHVVIVIGENTDYSSSVGGMTYLDSLANTYGLATNYHADTHPSIGNYFMLTTGQIITNDDSQTPSSLGLSTSQDNIAYEVQKAGKTWKDYEESTNGCGALNSGSYIVRHDPLVYFPNINTESANFVCMSQFSSDVSAGTLPNLSWLSPNGCDDAHDCSLSTFDGFLSHYLTPLLASKYFQPGGDGLLIVVFDENSGTSGNQVEWVGVSPHSFPAFQSSVSYAHENTLRTMAQGLGASFSGLGAAATAAPMSDFFNVSAGSVSLSPTSLSFGNVAVGTTSAAKSLTLTNSTASAASLSIGITGTNASEFSQTHTCGSSLAAGSSCTISVTFKPTTASAAVATLNTGVTGVTAALTGTGVTAGASLSPTSLTFPSTTVGATSAAQTSTLTNTGGLALTINGVAISSNYADTNTCGSSLAVGAKCTISVTFKPTTSGTLTGQLTVTTTPAVSGLTISLNGTGVASNTPTASLSPTSLTFPSTAVGTASAAQSVTLKNVSTASMSISSIGATTPFGQTNSCGTSLAAGASCTISVTFKPTATGSVTGKLSITDNATGSPQTVSLAGTGVSATGPVSLSPSSLTFASTTVGSTSATQTVTLSSLKSSAVSPGIAISGTNPGDFAQTNNCGTSLAAGAKCTISVTFKPTATGTRTATLTSTAATQAVSLSGTGAAPSTVSLSPSPLTFASLTVGTTSAVEISTLTNKSGSSITFSNFSISGTNASDFAFGGLGTCGGTLANGGTCTVSIKFTPSATGTRTAQVNIPDNIGTQTLPLSGTGASSTTGSVSLSPSPLLFPSQTVGTTSAVEFSTLTNKTGSAITFSNFSISGTNASNFAFGGLGTCGGTLANGGTCTISIKFTPSATGTRTAQVNIPNSLGTQTLPLSGTGK
ncbi:MAG: hypothetical protein DMG21_07005 [Acidobacteria bacterium]|nr:MAG: hypothetical protein DMG21_07005 [Acidobacteriota bacterium]